MAIVREIDTKNIIQEAKYTYIIKTNAMHKRKQVYQIQHARTLEQLAIAFTNNIKLMYNLYFTIILLKKIKKNMHNYNKNSIQNTINKFSLKVKPFGGDY